MTIISIHRIIDAACKVGGVTPDGLAGASQQPKYRRVRKAAQEVAVSHGHSYQDINAAMGRTHGARFGRLIDRELVQAIETELIRMSPTPVTFVISPSAMLHLLETSDEHRKAAALWVHDRLRLRYDPTRFARPGESPSRCQRAEVPHD